MRVLLFSLMALVSLSACAPPEAPAPEVDLAAERDALLSADKAWFTAYSTSETPVDAFLSHMVDGARFQMADNPPAEGKEAIRGVLTQMLELPGFSVEWSATAADVSSSADLGYTVGTYEMKMEVDGEPMIVDGHYVTIWEKQADGSWKVVVDTGGPSGPPRPAEE